ncbi:LptF/LptG family permease [Oceanithermus profundus]|uniref:Permease YjgP/YjgQ family protein n=1 Tax=Oceanithermus profundus (strain DSM 14977 / NBRC 100410 / VKM B-2274 / 506) TaxID=670487 RepID=E4UA02_OCEP5|nr:LptF/LptG family permease [Oceanithermus profundus]ADR37379.1 permease YjgP/YjgQ family protein [Oceanithermus profundus DSM 14977]
MNTLSRYLLREVGAYLLGGLAVVVLLLLGGVLFEVLAPLLARGADPLSIGQYLAHRVPEALVRGLPIAYLFALLLALSRMAEDSELKVLLASGIPRERVLGVLVGFGALLALVGFVAGESWVPRELQRANQVLREAILAKPRALLQPGTFFRDAYGRTIYVGQVDGQGFGDVRVLSEGEVLTAKRGRFEPGRLVLDAGMRVTFDGSRPRTITEFERGLLPLEDLAVSPPTKPADLPLAELRRRIAEYKKFGRPYHAEATAYWRKWAEPAASVAFALFAVALAFWMLGGSRSLGMVGVVTLTFFYYATWSVFRIMGEQGVLAPWFAAWGPDLLYAGVAGLLLLGGKR